MQVTRLVTEKEKTPNFAPSLPAVPNVQEMVRKNPSQVPQRYIRSQEEMENVMPNLSSEIPVIDLTLLSYGNTEELLKLDIACKKWGFFQRMKDAATEFFKLPIEEKNKYAMPSNGRQGYGLSYAVSEEQKLDWEIIEAYSSEIKRVGEELLSSLSVIMELQKHVLLGLHKELVQSLRVNYYPPCSTPEQALGLTPHSDTTTITLLMQDDDVPGLEIRHKGNWVPVTPISDALVVNVGDVIEIWSNGKYKSVEHRAVANKNKARTSHASFLFPSGDIEVEPFDHMIDAQNPKSYKKIRYGDYLRQSIMRKMEGKSHLDVKA
ncbi:Oxoglutarate/iron-dependent dioxygenase [Sesbania bispinosa]|nr:Oxoglutarate/iron-dependent dioxygenase [Sesbania bispinosa]